MVSSQLLIAEIGTEIRDRIVKDGCHVQAVLLRPRPGRRETIFGKDLGKQDPGGLLHGMTFNGCTGMRSRRYRMPAFLDRPVKLPQLLEFLLRGKHIRPESRVPDYKNGAGVSLKCVAQTACDTDNPGVCRIARGIRHIDQHTTAGTRLPRGFGMFGRQQTAILFDEAFPGKELLEARNRLRSLLYIRTASSQHPARFVGHLRVVRAQEPWMRDYLRMRAGVEREDKSAEPLHFRKRQIETLPTRERQGQIALCQDLLQFPIVGGADRHNRPGKPGGNLEAGGVREHNQSCFRMVGLDARQNVESRVGVFVAVWLPSARIHDRLSAFGPELPNDVQRVTPISDGGPGCAAKCRKPRRSFCSSMAPIGPYS